MPLAMTRAFLDIETSASGRRWVGPSDTDERLAEAINQQARIPLPVARILARQGVSPADAIAYLTPALRDLMPDPLTLRDMGPAAARLVAAVLRGQRVAIFADYDVDGGSSAALLIWWLRSLGGRATLYIPDRIDEGYGPNVPAMQGLGRAHDLIVCVDCGTLSHDAVAAAGCDVVVLDHHLAAETLPDCVAVVNPNRQDEDGALSYLCAAGVVFLMLVEANRQLRAEGRQGPDLMALLDLVALATVADVAPLVGLNRALVRQGLRVMMRRERPGLAALADLARLTAPPTAFSLGFILGPRVNAGGRIGQADLGARLLATDDPVEAAALAARLDELNTERRAIEAAVRAAAEVQVLARGADGPLVWAAAEGWHPGVVGIVAARLKEMFDRPAIVLGIDGGVAKGSGRSVAGVDLGAAVQRLAAEGLALKGGGHKMAAGLTLAPDRIDAAMARLGDLLARQGAGIGGPRDLRLDGLMSAGAATPALAESLDAAGPYGQAAPAPRYAFAAMQVSVRRVGETHLRLTARDASGSIDGICFGAVDGPLGPLLTTQPLPRLHLAGRPELSHFGGRTRVELRLDDAAVA